MYRVYGGSVYRRRWGVRLVLALVVIAVGGGYWVWRFRGRVFFRQLFVPANSYDTIIEAAAKRHDIDVDLLRSVIWCESRFDANAVGDKGEIGLMQLMVDNGAVAEWANSMGVAIPPRGVLFRPEVNIDIGAWYLARALKRWEKYKHCYELALSQYNAGEGAVRDWVPDSFDGDVVSKITISSTRAYVLAIMDRYKYYASRREAE